MKFLLLEAAIAKVRKERHGGGRLGFQPGAFNWFQHATEEEMTEEKKKVEIEEITDISCKTCGVN